jgi:transposase
MRSTGAIPSTPGDRGLRDSCGKVNRVASKGVKSQALQRNFGYSDDMDATPDDIASLRAALAEAQARAAAAEADLARVRARTSGAEAIIVALKLEIERLRRELHGRRSERTSRLIDQLELELEELEAKATEDELAAEATPTSAGGDAPRRRPSRKPFPDHLPRERVVVPAPANCACCG